MNEKRPNTEQVSFNSTKKIHRKNHYRSNSLENMKKRSSSRLFFVSVRVDVYLFVFIILKKNAKNHILLQTNTESKREKGNSSLLSLLLWLQLPSCSGCCRSKPVLNHIQTYTYTLTSMITTFVYIHCISKVRPMESVCELIEFPSQSPLIALLLLWPLSPPTHHTTNAVTVAAVILCNRIKKQWNTFCWLCHCHFQYERKSQSTSLLYRQ